MSAEKRIQEAEFAIACGLFEAAETAFREALHLSEKTGDSSLLAQAARGLAVIYHSKQDYEQMSKYALEALPKDEMFWGPNSTQIADDAALAAKALMFTGDFERAEKLYQESLTVRRNYYEETHAQIVSLQAGLLLLYLRQSMLAAAIEAHNIILPIYKSIASGAKWTSFLKLDKLVDHLSQKSQDGDAEMLISRELDILRQHFRTYREEINDVTLTHKKLLAKEGRALAAWKINVQQRADTNTPLKLLLQAKQHLDAGDLGKSDDLFRQAIDKTYADYGVHSPQASDLRRAYLGGAAKDSKFLDNVLSSISNYGSSNAIRNAVPAFIDALADLVQSGVSVPAAVELACGQCQKQHPRLSAEITNAIQALKMHRTPLSQSLALIGQKYGVDELVNLSSTLAAATKTSGSICTQLREQSFALRHHLAVDELAKRNFMAGFTAGATSKSAPSLLMKMEEEHKKRRQQNRTT